LNLLDTPGHVDFSYEVSRSLAACEGALLLVDAAQGVEAQTVANVHLAHQADLVVIPVINKIDLPSSDVDRVKGEVEEDIGLDASEAIPVSAKEGTGVKALLDAIVHRLPPPSGSKDAPLKALLFDSWFDAYRGVIILTRVLDGTVKKGTKIRLMQTGKDYDVVEVGAFTPGPERLAELSAGQVGFVIANIKDIQHAKVGDTITEASRPAEEKLPGFKDVHPMVYAGFFPIDSKDYEDLKEALEKLQLNDAAIYFEPETSQALGFGFRCGFLGLLHMEIIQERLEREHNLALITTAPTVVYHVYKNDGEMIRVDNPAHLPKTTEISRIEEPMIIANLHVPNEYVGPIMKLCEERRGTQKNLSYASKRRIIVTYELPLAEVVYDFYDRLKSVSRGYAS
ncbi:MAG: translation elongation factor 4, partial [Planctomycetota bacterium]